ncbi:cytochrome P450 [Melampsora americana]|nr:cytochrome P450 [Melampsora americana]
MDPNAGIILDEMMLLMLLVYLISQIKYQYKEYSSQKKAKSLNSKLAPLVTYTLPFDLRFLYHKVVSHYKSDPSSSLDYLNSYSKSTKAIRFNVLGTEVIQTFSHLDVKYILSKNFQNWGKSDNFMKAFNPLLGEGIFNSDQRSLWSWHRSLSKPHFSKQRISDVNACEEHVQRLVHWIEIQIQSNRSIDIQDLFSRLTLTVATQHFFGHCLDMLNELLIDRPIKEGGIDVTAFSKDFADAQNHCLDHALFPSFISELSNKLSPNSSIHRVLASIDVLIENAVKERPMPDVSDDQQEPDNLLDQMRASGCSDRLLRHELVNLLLASRDTTSSLLTSCIYELAGRDQLWNELQSESSHLAQTSIISLDQINQCKLLRAVINETLRLHPPVWSNVRRAIGDDVLPSGTFVPAGTDCRFLVREFQRDPELWGMDAGEFEPNRWLDGRQILQSKDPFSFQPFSAGPRICLGQQFAYTEVSITLIRLINRFSRLELVGKSANRENIKEIQSVTLSFQDGLWVKFHS